MKHTIKETFYKYFFNTQRWIYFEIALLYFSVYLQGNRQSAIIFQEHDNENI